MVLTTEQILKTVCDLKNTDIKLIKSKCRKRSLVEIRELFTYVSFSYFRKTLTEIGEALGGRDHSTAINLKINFIQKLKDKRNDAKEDVDLILCELKLKYGLNESQLLNVGNENYFVERCKFLEKALTIKSNQISNLRIENFNLKFEIRKLKGEKIKEPVSISQTIEHPKGVYSNQKSLYPQLNEAV